MSLTLYVDGDRFRAHLRTTLARHPDLVPVAKGNGYGLGNSRLAQIAGWLGVDTLAVSLSPSLSTSLAINSLDIGSGGAQSSAIIAVDAAINTIASLRGRLAAVQNRLGSTLTNISVATEQLSAAESRIRDVDVAYETAQLTRNSILQQASISILAQANAQPQSALALLA